MIVADEIESDEMESTTSKDVTRNLLKFGFQLCYIIDNPTISRAEAEFDRGFSR